MLRQFSRVVLLLFPLLQIFNQVVVAVPPTIGIQRDWLNLNEGIYSYSGIIQFSDDTKDAEGKFPPQTMSAEKFLRLVAIAHDEMVTLHAAKTLRTDRRPGAMIGLTYGNRIYFASSMKGDYQSFYDPSDGDVDSKFRDLIAKAITKCQRIGEYTHRRDLACGEPNAFDLWLSKRPKPTVDDTPELRMIDWLTTDGVLADRFNNGPCGNKVTHGWGCFQLLEALNVQTYKAVKPDSGDGSEWAGKFEKIDNPRLLQ